MDTIYEALAAYDDMLDEYNNNWVGGIHFESSRILKTLDPIAYRVGFHDFLNDEGIFMEDLEGWDEVEL